MDNNDVAGPAVAFDAVGAVGQQLRPVSDSLIKARLLARMPVYVVAFVAAVAAAVLHSPWWWIAAALVGDCWVAVVVDSASGALHWVG